MSIVFRSFLCETLLLVSFHPGGEPAHDIKSALDVKIHAVLPASMATAQTFGSCRQQYVYQFDRRSGFAFGVVATDIDTRSTNTIRVTLFG